MSSRIRILYYDTQQHAAAFVGNRAIQELEKQYLRHRKPATVYTKATTEDYKKPHLLVPQMNMRTGDMENFTVQKNVILDCPENLKGAPRAEWLWDNMAPGGKTHGVLHIAREGRNRQWSKQAAHPLRYGMARKPPAKAKKGTTYAELVAKERARQGRAGATSAPVGLGGRSVPDHEEPPPNKLKIGIWA